MKKLIERIERLNGPMRRAIPWVLACGLALGALPARGQTCVTDAAWQAAVNGLNNTDNATHAAALYRALLTFQAAERSSGVLPAWPTRHGAQPTTTITAEEARAARGGGAWGGWDHIIDSLQCLDDAEQVVQDPDPPEDPDPPAPPPAQDAAGCVTDDAWSSAVSGLGGTNSASHAQAFYRALIRFQAAERSNGILPIWPTRHGAQPTTAITAAEARAARGGGAWGGWDHVIDALQCLDDAEAPAASDTDDDEVVVVDPEPETPPQPLHASAAQCVPPSGPAPEGWDRGPARYGTLSISYPGGTRSSSPSEGGGLNQPIRIELEVDTFGDGSTGSDTTYEQFTAGARGYGFCVYGLQGALEIEGLHSANDGTAACGVVDQTAAGTWTKAKGAGPRGCVSFDSHLIAPDNDVVGDIKVGRLSALVRQYISKSLSPDGNEWGHWRFPRSPDPGITVNDNGDVATLTIERDFTYGGAHHGWNWVLRTDKRIVTQDGGGAHESRHFWNLNLKTSEGNGYWVQVPSGGPHRSQRLTGYLRLRDVTINNNDNRRPLKHWCGEHGSLTFSSAAITDTKGVDDNQVTVVGPVGGSDLCR